MSEKDLLKKMKNGDYDGVRQDKEQNGVSWGYYIDNGEPVQFKYGKPSKVFDGKENVKTHGKENKTLFDTDEKKIAFLQKHGYRSELFGNHPEVMDYSNKYYESQKEKK